MYVYCRIVCEGKKGEDSDEVTCIMAGNPEAAEQVVGRAQTPSQTRSNVIVQLASAPPAAALSARSTFAYGQGIPRNPAARGATAS